MPDLIQRPCEDGYVGPLQADWSSQAVLGAHEDAGFASNPLMKQDISSYYYKSNFHDCQLGEWVQGL
jgi:hypothetical protein